MNFLLLFIENSFYVFSRELFSSSLHTPPPTWPVSHTFGLSTLCQQSYILFEHFLFISLSLTECYNSSTLSSSPYLDDFLIYSTMGLLIEHFIWLTKFFTLSFSVWVFFSIYVSLLNSIFISCAEFIISFIHVFSWRIYLHPL